MGSDKLANIREPLSEIHFELKTGHGKKNTSLELGKEELKMLIEKMEAANKVNFEIGQLYLLYLQKRFQPNIC